MAPREEQLGGVKNNFPGVGNVGTGAISGWFGAGICWCEAGYVGVKEHSFVWRSICWSKRAYFGVKQYVLEWSGRKSAKRRKISVTSPVSEVGSY